MKEYFYNYYKKEKFLKNQNNISSNCYALKAYKTLFNKTRKYEYEKNKDLSGFEYDDIFQMLLKLNLSFAKKIEAVGLIENYYIFYNNYRKDIFTKLRSFLNLSKPYNKKIVPIYFNEIQNALNILKNPSDKFFVYGLFCGIKGKNYIELNLSSFHDSDPETRLIWLAGIDNNGNVNTKLRKFYADRQLFEFAKTSAYTKDYSYDTLQGTKTRKTNNESSLIIKNNKKDDTFNISSYRSITLRKFARLSENFNIFKGKVPDDVYWSGFVYNIRMLELKNNRKIIDAIEILTLPGFDKLKEQYNITIENRSLIPRLRRYF